MKISGEVIIAKEKLNLVLSSVFEGKPTVYESASKFDCDLLAFFKVEDLTKYIQSVLESGDKYIQLAIYYPESKGFVFLEKIKLDPIVCKGAKFRSFPKGWGLIWFSIWKNDKETFKCFFSVNSNKRAQKWAPTYIELGDPKEWDWIIVEKNIRRLKKVLKNCV